MEFLDEGLLDSDKEERLANFRDHFNFSQEELDKNGALTKTAKASVLREVAVGNIPSTMRISGALPINPQKGEQIVWAFSGSQYMEDKIRRQSVGHSNGMSVRVMKGVYYRTGEFRRHTVEHTERVHIDTGWLLVTNRNIYFAGPEKSLRLPYNKIVSFQPFSDGIGVMRDTATAKLQAFVTGDGWFTYNLVTNLAKL